MGWCQPHVHACSAVFYHTPRLHLFLYSSWTSPALNQHVTTNPMCQTANKLRPAAPVDNKAEQLMLPATGLIREYSLMHAPRICCPLLLLHKRRKGSGRGIVSVLVPGRIHGPAALLVQQCARSQTLETEQQPPSNCS